MGLLQQDKVVFYHPLDDSTEWTQSEAWDGTADYGLGKVDNALEAVATVEGFGGASEYTATEAIFNHIAALNSSKVVVAYQNLTGLSGRARVGTISGTGITWGAVSPFMTTATGGARTPIAVLSETKVVVAYQEGADSKNGRARLAPSAARTSHGAPRRSSCPWTGRITSPWPSRS